jgi:hypothetical protein
MILKTRHRLADGHKCLYILLVRRWGQKGPCFPSQASLAADLGRSLRQVKVWIADLEAFGLIRYRRRGRGDGGQGLTNDYTFLWHRIFEVQNPPKVRFSKCESDRFEVRKSTVLKCEDQHALDKEETRTKETYTERSSSSSEDTGQLREVDSNAAATTTPRFPKNKKRESAGWWTPDELISAKHALAKHRSPCSARALPDSAITTQVLHHFSNFAEFTVWIEDLSKRFPGKKVQTWGFYEHDARCLWPQRHNEVEAALAAKLQADARERERQRLESVRRQAESEAANLEAERKRREREGLVAKCRARGWKRMKAVDCGQCAGFGRNPENEQTCSCEAGAVLARELKKCPKCEFEGVVFRSDDSHMLDWCDCEYATRLRVSKPDHVLKHNRGIERWRSRQRSITAISGRSA